MNRGGAGFRVVPHFDSSETGDVVDGIPDSLKTRSRRRRHRRGKMPLWYLRSSMNVLRVLRPLAIPRGRVGDGFTSTMA
jgi:hypothetical protein